MFLRIPFFSLCLLEKLLPIHVVIHSSKLPVACLYACGFKITSREKSKSFITNGSIFSDNSVLHVLVFPARYLNFKDCVLRYAQHDQRAKIIKSRRRSVLANSSIANTRLFSAMSVGKQSRVGLVGLLLFSAYNLN